MALIGINPEPNVPGEAFVFIPSIYGEYFYSDIYYGGQWLPIGLGPGQPVPISVVTFPQTPFVPPGYNIAPFTAIAVDYSTIFLSWTQPQGPFIDFRILRSRYGFPVDENDGAILSDSSTNISGNQWYDTEVIPGTMHYYGIYILLDLSDGGPSWYRAGLVACLAIGNTYDSTNWMLDKLPEYFKIVGDESDLTTSDATNNVYLDQFMSVLGWGADYFKTYLALAAQANNPKIIPVNWLESLAGTLGAPFYADISQATTRDAIANYSTLVKERGTLEGIEAFITQFTGWGADIRIGYNLMLEDDQSHFTDPTYQTWSANVSYNSGEIVNYNLYNFISLQSLNYNNTPFLNANPFFTNGSLSGWVGYGGSILATTGGPNNTSGFTWSLLFSSSANGHIAAMEQNASFAVQPDGTYSVTAWVYPTSSQTVELGLDWDSGTAYISTSTSSFTPTANTWTQISATGLIAPGNAAYAYPRVGFNLPSGSASMYIQGVIAISGSTYMWSTMYYDTALPPAPDAIELPNTCRTDTNCSMTAGLTTVIDTNAQVSDLGSNIYNPNIPAGAVITQVEVSQSYIISMPVIATATSQSVVVGSSAVNNNNAAAYLTMSGGSVSAIYINSVLQSTTSGTYLVPENGYVSLVYSSNPTTFVTYAPQLLNPVTGWLNTWEPLLDSATNQVPNTQAALVEITGISSVQGLNYNRNGLYITNTGGTTSNLELRSVSRNTADQAAGSTYPDRTQVIGDGIPVPWTLTSQIYEPATQYATGDIVTYNGLPFLALTGSKGITPPVNGLANDQWQPIGYDQRIALMLSGYSSQNLQTQPGNEAATTPYVLWFDDTGTIIGSPLYIRTPSTGNAPSNIMFDSFALPSNYGTNVTSTTPDIGGVANNGSQFSYTAQVNNFACNGYGDGSIVPTAATGQNIVTVNYGSANAEVGITILALPNANYYSGLVVRYASTTSYIRVDQNQVVQVDGAKNPALATHTTPFQSGDRMVVNCNGNVIQVSRNGSVVSTVTTTFNNTQTNFGPLMDNIAPSQPGTPQPPAIQQLQKQTRKATPKRKRRTTRKTSSGGEVTGA